MTENVRFLPKFVNTKNVDKFAVMMRGLNLSKQGRGECDERLAVVYGQAGRGKTRTIQAYAARNNCIFLETVMVWSELDFLQAFCRELGIRNPPGRRGRCFQEITAALSFEPRPVFVDEIERFGQRYLELIRDMAKITAGLYVLIGEEELPVLTKMNRRVWSRTYQFMEFEPITAGDISLFVLQTTGLTLSNAAVGIMHKASGGDLRVVRRDTINLVHVVNSLKRFGEVDGETASIAVKTGLTK